MIFIAIIIIIINIILTGMIIIIPLPSAAYKPAFETDLSVPQKKLALETIARVVSSFPAAHRLCADGSLQTDGSAACAGSSPALEPPHGGRGGRRFPNSCSFTTCEHMDSWMPLLFKYKLEIMV